MERSNDFLDLCDSLIILICEKREEHMRRTAKNEELLCGEWFQDDSLISFRVFEDGGLYMFETRTANKVNGHVKKYSSELKSDGRGNFYYGGFEIAICYDRYQDLLTVDGYGLYERKNTKNEK